MSKYQVAEASAHYFATAPVEKSVTVVAKGYKQTEVGVIPEDWEVVSLSEIAKVRGGKRLPKGESLLNTPTSHPYIRVADMIEGGVDCSDLHYVPDDIAPIIKNYRIYEGELFISVAGTLGIVGSISKELDGANLTENADRICYIKADSSYILYCLSGKRIQDEIASQSTVGAQPKLALGRIESFLIPLPTNKIEQTAIANALSDVDALINEQEKLIDKKQAIKTATMQQLLTGRTRLAPFNGELKIENGERKEHSQLSTFNSPLNKKGYKTTELGEVPEDWEVVEFGDIASPSPKRVNPKISGGGDYCVELEHIDQCNGTINGSTVTTADSSIKSCFEAQDVLFGKLRSYLRKFWLADRSGVCSTEIWVLKPINEKLKASYLYQLVQTDDFVIATSEAYGTHMPRADWSVVKGLMLAVPSKEEQTAIATILSDMDQEIQTLQQRLSKTRQLKQGMMQELLTGRTRLTNGKLTMENEK